MNKQALVIALGSALLCMSVQAAESVIETQDKPKASAAQSARRTEAKPVDRSATASSARRTGIEQGKVREVFGPMDRTGMSRRGKQAEIIEPPNNPRQLMGPGHRSGVIKPTDRPRRDNEKTTPLLPRGPVEDSSVVEPDFTVSDAKAAARERWRALAEEFAFGYVGDFITKLARPTGEDFEGPAPDPHRCAGPVTPDNRCAASPITRRDR